MLSSLGNFLIHPIIDGDITTNKFSEILNLLSTKLKTLKQILCKNTPHIQYYFFINNLFIFYKKLNYSTKFQQKFNKTNRTKKWLSSGGKPTYSPRFGKIDVMWSNIPLHRQIFFQKKQIIRNHGSIFLRS